MLVLATSTCNWAVDGHTQTGIDTELLAVLDGTKIPYPESVHDTSNLFGTGRHSDFYLLGFATSDPALALWMQTGTGLPSTIAQYAPELNLSFTSGLLFGQESFVAPKPFESPFAFTQTVSHSVAGAPILVHNFWRETRSGTARVEVNASGNPTGQFLDWNLTTDPTSPLGQMIGGSSASSTCGTQAIDPLLGFAAQQVDLGCLSGATGGGTFTKELITR